MKGAGVSLELPETTAPGLSENRTEGDGGSNCTIWERRNSRKRINEGRRDWEKL